MMRASEFINPPVSGNEEEKFLKIFYQKTSKFIELPLDYDGKLSLADIKTLEPNCFALNLTTTDSKKLCKPKNGYFKEPQEKWSSFKVVALLEDSTNGSSSDSANTPIFNASASPGLPNLSPALSPRAPTVVDDLTLAVRLAENQQSIIFMNVAECNAFDPAEKRCSDRDIVQKILDFVGVSPPVETVSRFSPKTLPADRPPFLKVRFSSEAEKKKVFYAVISNISRIRSYDNMFAEITVTDPAKSAKLGNNARSDTVSRFDSCSSNYTVRQPQTRFDTNHAAYTPPSSSFVKGTLSPSAIPSAFGSGNRQYSSASFADVTRVSANHTPYTPPASSVEKSTSSPSAIPSTFGSGNRQYSSASFADVTRVSANHTPDTPPASSVEKSNSSPSAIPSTFGSASNVDVARFDTNHTPYAQPSSNFDKGTSPPSAFASRQRSSASNIDETRVGTNLYAPKNTLSSAARSRVQQMFSSPKKPDRSTSVSHVRYTRANADGVYTSDDE